MGWKPRNIDMDFSKLETKTGAEKGAKLHLRHPALGHLLYSGKGADENGKLIDAAKDAQKVFLMVRGTESPTVQKQARDLQASILKNGDISDEEKEVGLAFASSLVISMHGLEKGGKTMEATEENKREFLLLSDGLVEQVVQFAQSRANFFNPA
ncbi:MAG: hypothetical protein JXR15_12545 [Shimia sp.]